jgi:hypothetical protein
MSPDELGVAISDFFFIIYLDKKARAIIELSK